MTASWIPFVAGALILEGVWLVVQGLAPRRPPLAALLAPPAPPEPIDGSTPVAALTRLGRTVARSSGMIGLRASLPAPADLAVAGRSPEAHLGLKVASVAAVGTVAAVLVTLGRALDRPLPGPLVLLLIGCTVAAYVGPDTSLRASARRRRASFVHASGSVIDFLAALVAGGSSPEEALTEACRERPGWPYQRIQYVVENARRHREDSWSALERLGAQVGIPELEHVGSRMQLATTQGTATSDALLAEAKALRARQRHEAEAAAEATTEHMTFPLVGVAAVFLAFLFYATLYQIAHVV